MRSHLILIGGVKLDEGTNTTKVVGQHFIPEENELVEPKTINLMRLTQKTNGTQKKLQMCLMSMVELLFLLVNVLLPGSGKAHSVEKCKGKKTLIVAPFIVSKH